MYDKRRCAGGVQPQQKTKKKEIGTLLVGESLENTKLGGKKGRARCFSSDFGGKRGGCEKNRAIAVKGRKSQFS